MIVVYDKSLPFLRNYRKDSSAFATRTVRYQGFSKCCLRKKKHNRNDNATSAGPSPERFSSNMMLHFLDFALLLERDLSCHQDIQIMRCATRDCSAMQCLRTSRTPGLGASLLLLFPAPGYGRSPGGSTLSTDTSNHSIGTTEFSQRAKSDPDRSARVKSSWQHTGWTWLDIRYKHTK